MTSTSSRTTHHFDWKKLEEKPDNWDTLRQLINICNTSDDVYTENVQQNTIWNATCMDIFKKQIIDRYGKDTEVFFPIIKPKEDPKEKQQKKKNNNKKTKNPLREKIQQETERKLLEKDFTSIKFDKNTPIKTTFRCDSVFYFMIAEWVIMLWKKRDMDLDKGVIVNAMISLDRIVLEEILVNTDIIDEIRDFFVDLNTKCQHFLKREDIFHQLFYCHPELMVNPFSQKRAGRISLYKEQISLLTHTIDAVMLGSPLLLGDRMPPGTGKTFLAVPLAQKLQALKCGKTLLFACHNSLVRTDVASLSLLGKSMHLWMGRSDATTGVREYLIRPHKSCFPVNWKQVYKEKNDRKTGGVFQQFQFYKNATGRFPDILVADLETCAEILRDPILNPQFIAYIDEFVSDKYANGLMIDIIQHLPRQSVLLSAILPSFHQMPNLIQYFKNKHNAKDEHIIRIESNQLTISCTLVGPDGRVSLPHHFIEDVSQIPMLIERMIGDPLLSRMYAPQEVFQMIDFISDDLVGSGLLFQDRFSSIAKIDHEKVRDYVLDLLRYVRDKPDIFNKIKNFRRRIMENPPSISSIATIDSHHYQGKTLVITTEEDRFSVLQQIKDKLHENAPDINEMLETLEKRKKELEKLMQNTKETERKSHQKIDAVDHQQRINQLEEDIHSANCINWPQQFIVNTSAHAKRFNHKISNYAMMPILSEEYETAFSDFLLSFLLSGIGTYDFSQCTEYQRRLTMKVMKQLSFLFAGHEIVFGTNIDGLTHLFIDGNYGDNVSRNELHQLAGRAGRMGRSYSALIVVNSDATLNKIMSFIDNTDPDAEFFNNYFQQLI